MGQGLEQRARNEAARENSLGMAAMSRGDGAAAARHFEAAAAHDPKAPALWINLAKAHRLCGDDEAERAALERVLTIDQTHVMALIRLAQLHERLHEAARAAERWSAVAQLSVGVPGAPAELQAIFDHARSFVAAKRESLGRAIDGDLSDQLDRASEGDRRRMRAAADVMLGRRAIYTNRCEGMHYPFLPADEYFDRAHFPWLAELEAATAVIREEVQAIMAMPASVLAPYVAMPAGTPDNKWTPLDGSLAWSALHLWKDGRRVEEACALAPRTAALLETLPLCRIPNRAPTAFFSILKAGKHIPAHTGVTNTRAIVHLPLIVPPGCAFRVGGETRDWREGEAFAFDDTIEHEAWNRSDRDRAVLILDTWNPHLSDHERSMICRLFEVADRERDSA